MVWCGVVCNCPSQAVAQASSAHCLTTSVSGMCDQHSSGSSRHSTLVAVQDTEFKVSSRRQPAATHINKQGLHVKSTELLGNEVIITNRYRDDANPVFDRPMDVSQSLRGVVCLGNGGSDKNGYIKRREFRLRGTFFGYRTGRSADKFIHNNRLSRNPSR
jgi:hypothetical protein